jgi:chaperonin GroES
MKFRPLHDRVVVRRLTAEEKTAGGIIIPGTAQEKPMEGEIVAVGPGARDELGGLVPLTVQPGDHVLFGKWSGTEVKLGGEELLIMKESDIMGITRSAAPASKAAKPVAVKEVAKPAAKAAAKPAAKPAAKTVAAKPAAKAAAKPVAAKPAAKPAAKAAAKPAGKRKAG